MYVCIFKLISFFVKIENWIQKVQRLVHEHLPQPLKMVIKFLLRKPNTYLYICSMQYTQLILKISS